MGEDDLMPLLLPLDLEIEESVEDSGQDLTEEDELEINVII